jgi:chromosome segregation ATPase
MRSNWKLLGIPVVLTAVLAAAPAHAGPIENPPPADNRVDELSLKLEELRKQVVNTQLNVATLQKDINDLKDQIAALQQSIDSLRKQTTTVLRPATPDETGTLMLVNRYDQAMDVVVNQNVYRLQPNETRELTLPAGAFSYWIPRAQRETQNRTLNAKATFRITVQ